MANKLYDMLPTVTDERSFLRFLTALREDCEAHERDCDNRSSFDCAQQDHWETASTKHFLRSMEEWAGGDFADGYHGDDPLLRRVATMLLVGRHYAPGDRPR